MLIRNAKGEYETIDFRETAPEGSKYDMFNHDIHSSTIGGLAVGIPGEMAGFKLAHERHGKVAWSTLFAPSIKLARDGWTVSKKLESMIPVNFYC